MLKALALVAVIWVDLVLKLLFMSRKHKIKVCVIRKLFVNNEAITVSLAIIFIFHFSQILVFPFHAPVMEIYIPVLVNEINTLSKW